MRWARGVFAERNRRVGPQENRSRVVDKVQKRFRISRQYLEMFGGNLVRAGDGFCLIPRQNQCAEALKTFSGQVRSRKMLELAIERGRHLVQKGFVPCHKNAGGRRVLGLSNKVGGDE